MKNYRLWNFAEMRGFTLIMGMDIGHGCMVGSAVACRYIIGLLPMFSDVGLSALWVNYPGANDRY